MSKDRPQVLSFPTSAVSQALGLESPIGSGGSVPGLGSAPVLVHEPGTAVVSGLLHPAFQILERLYRVLPEEGWFSSAVSPNHPIQFPLGAYEVPKNMALWLFEYRFQVYRFSGAVAGDMLPAERGRYSDTIGYDVTLSSRRLSDIQYQLDPVNVPFNRPMFNARIGQPKTGAQFDRDAAGDFAATASAGKSLLPNRWEMQGPSNGPFTFVVKDGDSVTLNAVLWRPFLTPVACVEGQLAGYLLQTQISDALINRLRPR